MELPDNLKHLYRHWPLHTGTGAIPYPTEPLYAEISHFVRERLRIWEKKTRSEKPPFTDDPILSAYRFCNIFREFDKQTILFHTLLNPLRNDFPLWLLNMFYCRMVARPETIHELGLLMFGDNSNLYEKFLRLPRPKFGSPYVFPISTIQRSPTPTRELFIARHLPAVMEKVSREIQTWDKMSVKEGVERILPIFGYNLHFLWTETLIDVAYQYPERVDLFKDFPIGPGSAPTISRLGHSVVELAGMHFDTGVTFESQPLRLSSENWEGIGCEFRKYTNLKAGKGRRRIYK